MKINLIKTEKIMLLIAATSAAAGMITGYKAFVAGLAIAVPVSILLSRWQVAGVVELDNISPRRAFDTFYRRSLLRAVIFLGMLFLAQFVGIEFLLGVLLGLILQVLAFMGEAFFIILRKEG